MRSTRRHARFPFILIAILLLGLGLRLVPWGENRFLEDEALYAYWALQIATGADPMLDEEPVDKPPLHPYTLALSFLLTSSAPGVENQGMQAQETAARLPSLLASVAGIALIFALGRGLFGDPRVGLLAALLLALSPFDLLFASTAFTDPLMTALVLGALLAAARDHLGAAGLLAGLAAATKQQGLFFLPLVAAVGLLARPKRPPDVGWDGIPPHKRAFGWLGRLWGRRWLRFALGFILVAAAVLWWDAARVQRPGFWEQSLISYGGLEATQPADLGQRALAWLGMLGAFWISPWANALLLGGMVLWQLGDTAGWWPGGSRIDLALALFTLGFVLLHWLVGFQVWDRYLLPLVPLVALLAARGLASLGDAIRATPWRRAYAALLILVLVISLAGPILRAVGNEIWLGGDHGAYDGIDQLAAYLRAQAPPGAVLYHYWLGYHYRFYLYGAPLRLHWYPDPEDLTHDAYVYRREPRYIAFPTWKDSAPAVSALAREKIDLVPVMETVRRDGSISFRLYRLEGP